MSVVVVFANAGTVETVWTCDEWALVGSGIV
jgi:hypothetical protein